MDMGKRITDTNLTAIQNLDKFSAFSGDGDGGTVALLKARMGYTDKLRCCNECKNYRPVEEVCKVSNMGDIPVKPYATCEYYKRAAHVKPHSSEAIYQTKVEGEGHEWITVEKCWYENAVGISNVETQIIYPVD